MGIRGTVSNKSPGNMKLFEFRRRFRIKPLETQSYTNQVCFCHQKTEPLTREPLGFHFYRLDF